MQCLADKEILITSPYLKDRILAVYIQCYLVTAVLSTRQDQICYWVPIDH